MSIWISESRNSSSFRGFSRFFQHSSFSSSIILPSEACKSSCGWRHEHKTTQLIKTGSIVSVLPTLSTSSPLTCCKISLSASSGSFPQAATRCFRFPYWEAGTDFPWLYRWNQNTELNRIEMKWDVESRTLKTCRLRFDFYRDFGNKTQQLTVNKSFFLSFRSCKSNHSAFSSQDNIWTYLCSRKICI